MTNLSNQLGESAQGTVRRQEELTSPWNKFLNTIDSQKMSESDKMQLFAKTLAVAKSDWKDSNGDTLLMHMSSRGEVAIMRRLIHELYADVNAVNNDKQSALHMAARGGFKEACSELLDANANPCQENADHLTPSRLAHEMGHKEVADFIGRAETSKRLWTMGRAGQTY